MRIFTYFIFLFLLLAVWRCTNIDDAPLSQRSTFIQLYEGPLNFKAADVIQTSEGYLILGNMLELGGSQLTVLIKTDEQGNRIGDINYYSGGTGKCIKPFSNTSFTGYLIIGDSIKIDANAVEVSDIEITSARILAIDSDLDSVTSFTFSDKVSPTRKTDIRGVSLAVKADGGIIILITYEDYQSTIKPWVFSLNNDLTPEWEYQFSGLVRDFIPSKSIHHYSNNTILASSLLRQQGSFNEKYVSITRLEDYLSEDNTAYLGEYLDKSIAANDIQPANSIAFGFGVIGTYGETDGTKQNMFFTKVDVSGNLGIPPDTLFIDSFLSETDGNLSRVEDTGETLSSTSDGGFVLAGTMQTTSVDGTTIGKGERDIFLVKVNAAGSVVWTKLIGGTGDEVVSTIRETSDAGLVICGTNTIGGYSSIFLIKTDKNGELKN